MSNVEVCILVTKYNVQGFQKKDFLKLKDIANLHTIVMTRKVNNENYRLVIF